MSEEKLLTVREVAAILGISEKEILDLAESGAIPAYKVGGVYLRFKKEQVQEFRKSGKAIEPKAQKNKGYSFTERINDFLYFNDFYILAIVIIFLLLLIIFRGY